MIDERLEVTMDPTTACASCGAALDQDQSYCLHCGARRGEPRVEYRTLIPPTRAAGEAPAPGSAMRGGASPGAADAVAGAEPARDWTPVIALGGLAALALVLVVGVLLGRSGADGGRQTAAAPQVIRLEGGGATASPASSTTAIAEDWRAGTTGFTVSLGTLPKDGTTAAQVDAAKADATAKGATAVGVLDSDAHGSLSGGSWVIYSGVFDTRAAARRALARLKAKYPDARVIEVADSGGSGSGGGSDAGSGSGSGGGGSADAPVKAAPRALQDLEQSSGEDYQRKSRNLPDTLALPGKPPPKDNQAPGGGSDSETIG